MKQFFATAFKVIGVIIGALVGALVLSFIINFIPATLIFWLLAILGFHFTYWQVFFGTYLVVFIGNLLFGGKFVEIEKK